MESEFSDAFWDSPDYRAWEEDVIENLVPMIKKSDFVASLMPVGRADAKFAVELGFSIMFDKPLIMLVQPGVHVPEKLALIADDIIEADFSTPQGVESLKARVQASAERIAAEREAEGGGN